MTKGRTQLNVNIDPDLLIKLKSQAIKEGKTLTDFVVEKLKDTAIKTSEGNLEKRLLRIESVLNLNQQDIKSSKNIGSIFTDEGAKEYGAIAKEEFDLHVKKKGLTIQDALKELDRHLKNHPYSNPELVFQILLGSHELTGKEMTNAYRHGSCAMRDALNAWTNDPLERLNKAFLNAVKTKNLA